RPVNSRAEARRSCGLAQRRCYSGIDGTRNSMKYATAVAGEEAVILNRLVKPEQKLSQAAARALLRLDFDKEDRARMHALALKNQADELTAKEEIELLSY